MHMIIDWGNFTAQALQIFAPYIVAGSIAGVGFVLSKVSPGLSMYFHQKHVDTLLANAISAGIAKTEGAAVGQTLTVDIANKVLAEAVSYLNEHALQFLQTYGPRVESMLIARLAPHLPPEASSATLGIAKA